MMPTRQLLQALRGAYKAVAGGAGLVWGEKNRCQRGAAVWASGKITGHHVGTQAPPGGG